MKAKELRKAVEYGLSGIDENEELLSADAFAEKYGYSKTGIRSILKREKVPRAFKVGRIWYIPENADIIGRLYRRNK